jgi:hypothetical protein
VIVLHVFSDSSEAVAAVLEAEALRCEFRRKRVRHGDGEQTATCIRTEKNFRFELIISAAHLAGGALQSSATGRAIEQASIAEVEQLIERECGDEGVRDPEPNFPTPSADAGEVPGAVRLRRSLSGLRDAPGALELWSRKTRFIRATCSITASGNSSWPGNAFI